MKIKYYQSPAGNLTVVSANNQLIIRISDLSPFDVFYFTTNPDKSGKEIEADTSKCTIPDLFKMIDAKEAESATAAQTPTITKILK